MSFFNRHVTIVCSVLGVFLITVFTFVTIKFFTYDKNTKESYIINPLIQSKPTYCKLDIKYEKEVAKQLDVTSSRGLKEERKDIKSISTEPETELSTNNKIDVNSSSNNEEIIQEQETSIEEATSVKESENQESEPEEAFFEENCLEEAYLEESNLEETQMFETNSIGIIEIPKTGVYLQILNNVSVSGMERAACFLYSTGIINTSGTTILVSHNYQNGTLFSNNYQLEIGDTIFITTIDGNRVQYSIYDKFITDEDDISYINKNTTNNAEIALSTCTDDEVNRLIILAR